MNHIVSIQINPCHTLLFYYFTTTHENNEIWKETIPK